MSSASLCLNVICFFLLLSIVCLFEIKFLFATDVGQWTGSLLLLLLYISDVLRPKACLVPKLYSFFAAMFSSFSAKSMCTVNVQMNLMKFEKTWRESANNRSVALLHITMFTEMCWVTARVSSKKKPKKYRSQITLLC